MAYDQAKARENLSRLWRLLAEQMINLGYDPGDVIASCDSRALRRRWLSGDKLVRIYDKD